MIYGMVFGTDGIASRLAAAKFQFPIVYGPEPFERGSFATTIRFARDDAGTDVIEAPPGFKVNPRKHAARYLAAVCEIYAQSNVPGAIVADHEDLAEQIVDAVIVALNRWADEAKTAIRYGEMRYLRPEDLPVGPAFERWPGRVYRIKFAVGRGVMARDFLGAAKPESALGGFNNRTEARYTGQPDADPVIGCGSE